MAAEGPRFSFTLSGFGQDAFHVVRFSGSEGLSRLYEFDITLISKDKSIDLGKAVSAEAKLTVKRKDEQDVSWMGILRDFRQQQLMGEYAVYRAFLVPRTWLLTISQHSRIFLNQDLTQNLRDCLTDGGLAHGLDYDLNATQSYPRREYVCQYNESHFNFLSRWTERNGIYFYFDQSGQREKMVLTDTMNIHAAHPAGDTLHYAQASGLDQTVQGKAARNFHCEQRRVPREVKVKDYNYRTPNLDIQGSATVSEHGQGTVYVHGGHMRSLRQAGFLAGIRAESLKCREQVFFGEADAPFTLPGYTFTLKDHYREDMNREYLVMEVRHEGSQEAWLTSGLGLEGSGDKLFYRNGFAAIPSDVQFRAEIKTVKPVIQGALLATVDAEGSGQYAELDEHGRYKVIMPYDLSGRKDGHATTWLRMMQPYAGQGHGMHLPLHKGTEVAVIHQEGDPDRPVIAGAMHNPTHPSVVTNDNQTMANITTAGGNRIHMEDKDGSQRILMHVAASDNFIRIGAPNDPAGGDGLLGAGPGATNPAAGAASGTTPSQPASTPASTPASGAAPAAPAPGWVSDKMSPHDFASAGGGINIFTPNFFTLKAGFYNSVVLGENTSTTVGLGMSNNLGELHKFIIGFSTEFKFAGHTEFTPLWKELRGSVSKVAAKKENIIASITDMVVDHVQSIGELRQVVAQQSKTIADLTVTVGDHTEVLGEVDRWAAGVEETISEIDQFAANINQTVGEHTQTLGALTTTSGQVTQTSGDQTVTMGNQTLTAGDQTVTAADQTTTAASVQVVSANVDFV